ncbi:MAG: phosphatidate cytidylyltransferase [Gammaproteobacteria bacterium]|nr:phosphatidate cytidylyltransferase [Gammaproteobacteria bacterium]
MLIARIITALLLLPLSVYAILNLDLTSFTLVLSFIFLLAANEWANITKLSMLNRVVFVAIIAFLGLFCWFYLSSNLLAYIPVLASLLWLFFFYKVIIFPNNKLVNSSAINIAIGVIVIIPSWLAMVLLKQYDSIQIDSLVFDGGLAVLLLMCIVWIADTGAYFSGRKWGNKKLLVKVSPGKTLAGAYGAVILTTVIYAITYLIYSQNLYLLLVLLVLIPILVIVSILGDLFESMFKRTNDVKDSGHILPGHGGILDRIDSLTATAPFFYITILILEKIS